MAVTGAIIAAGSVGLVHASHAAWVVVADCGVMIVLLGLLSTGRQVPVSTPSRVPYSSTTRSATLVLRHRDGGR